MDKLKMMTKDKAKINYDILAHFFPNALTEKIVGTDENGRPIISRAIDVDVLRQEIACELVEGKEERYQFTWPEKKQSVVLSNLPTSKTLRPCKDRSIKFDETQNIYIEGDNLEALKLLQETYLGKIKVIYIDPPYNTGSDAFVYDDNRVISNEEFAEKSGQYDENGNLIYDMRTNNEGNGRFHTDWLNMMYPRLRLAKNLLSEDGAIFISIDDHECENLKKMCDEIFGADCFVANISWQRTYSIRNDSKGIPTEVEHLLVYGKNYYWEPGKLPRTEDMNSAYSNPDGDRCEWMSGSPVAPGAVTHQGMVYAIQHPFTGEMLYPSDSACWRYSQDQMLEYMNGWCKYVLKDIDDDEKRAAVCGIETKDVRKGVKAIVLEESLDISREKAQKVYDEGPWPRFYFTSGGTGGVRRKVYLDSVGGKIATNFWGYEDVGHTDEAKKEVKVLFGGTAPFDTPKPTRLLDRILTIAADDNSIILDFFSGSATTAHAVMKKNALEKKRIKYILVQMPEPSQSPKFDNLCDIGEARISAAAKKIKEEVEDAVFDDGVRVFKIDESNMKPVYYNPADTQQTILDLLSENIKEDRTSEDLLFQVMLELGVMLSSKIEETEIAGKKIFNVADGFLIACFDKNITEDTVTAIAQKKPYYAVFRDGSMANDSVATNFDQLFETYSPDTVRKVL